MGDWDGGWSESVDGGEGATDMYLDASQPLGSPELGEHQPATRPEMSWVKAQRRAEPPAADPGITDDERRQITEMVAKGTFARILLATPDVDATFADLVAAGVEVVQEPMDMPYGVRDCAVRDPAGNLLRIQQHPAA